MIQAAAVELARYKIRANAILPGWVESTMTAPAFADEKFVANVLPRMPVRRWGTGEDFSAIAVYLASPASAFHTGRLNPARRRLRDVLGTPAAVARLS